MPAYLSSQKDANAECNDSDRTLGKADFLHGAAQPALRLWKVEEKDAAVEHQALGQQ